MITLLLTTLGLSKIGLGTWLKIGGVAVVVLAPIVAYGIGHHNGDDAGYDRRVAEVAAASAQAELERKQDDKKIRGMSDYDLCVSGLRGSGMSIDPCEQLRGLQPE